MCGRYVSPDQAAIERAWRVHTWDMPALSRNFNVVPTSSVPLLRRAQNDNRLDLLPARWGFIPHWWKQDKPPRLTHNARSEEAANKPMWREPLRGGRCLIPAVGWYEWQRVEKIDSRTGKVKLVKQPHFIRRPDESIFCFAGLMSSAGTPGSGSEQLSCAILTQASAPSIVAVHDRMPVVLPDEAHARWLDPELRDAAQAIEYLRDHALVEFAHYAVSDRINRRAESTPSLVEPI